MQLESDQKQGIDKMEERVDFFSDYMREFEQKVMVPCAELGYFDKKIMVSLKKPRLLSTRFGRFVGSTFDYDEILVLNYYGLPKFSSRIRAAVDSRLQDGFEVKGVKSKVVYFASIKIKQISKLAPELTSSFADFKDFLVSTRDFRPSESLNMKTS